MSGLLKSKAFLFLAVTVLLGVGTILVVNQKSGTKQETEAKVAKATAPKVRPSTPEPPLPPAEDISAEPAKESPPVVTNAQISKSTLDSLKTTLAALGRLKDRSRSKDPNDRKASAADRKELQEKLKGIRGEVSKLVRESEPARKQLMEAIKSENDPYAKKQMANLLRGTDVETQSKYYKELASDSSPENQKVGIEMLGGLHTEDSLKSLVDAAENKSADKDVRSAAVRSLGMSIPFATGNTEYQDSARAALVDMVKPQYDADVRESAYRAIAMQTSLSPDDEKILSQAIQQETDPNVKRTAQFLQSVMEARRRGNTPGE